MPASATQNGHNKKAISPNFKYGDIVLLYNEHVGPCRMDKMQKLHCFYIDLPKL